MEHDEESISQFNCPNCGAPVSVEELRCPYCGTENSRAAQLLRDKEILEQQTRRVTAKAEAYAAAEKSRAEVLESTKGARKASRMLTRLIVACALLSIIFISVSMFCYLRAGMLTEKTLEPRAGTAAHEYLMQFNEYSDIYACAAFHEYVDDYFAAVDNNQLVRESLLRNLAYYGSAAYARCGQSYYQKENPALCEQERAFVVAFFKGQFNLSEDQAWFLYEDGTTLKTDDEDRAVYLLSKNMRERD